MKPTDALEIQRDYKGKCGNPAFRNVLSSMIMTASGILLSKDEKAISDKKIVNAYLDSALLVGKSNTPCYFVKNEMTDLIMFASQKLDDTDLFDANLVPSDKGFVYFEKPLAIRDVRGRELLVNVIVWEKGFSYNKQGIIVSAFNDAYNTPDEIAKMLLDEKGIANVGNLNMTTNIEIAKKHSKKSITTHNLNAIGRFHWVHSLNAVHGQVIGEVNKLPDEEETESLRKFSMNKEGNDFLEFSDEEWDKYKEENITPFTNIKRLIHTYFLIMSQTLTAKSPERGDRAQRRRQERENLPNEVLVIQFRKTRYTSADKGEEGAVNWSHRWIVGGHWRWQPYKDPASGGEIKKRIWISPYVKGPDDKPLKTKERVYVLAK